MCGYCSFQCIRSPNEHQTGHTTSVRTIFLEGEIKWSLDYEDKQIRRSLLTGPKAMESIVCIFADRLPSVVRVITAFFSTNVFPATDQNFKCFTPTDTKWVSEFGRNRARKIRSSEPIVHATQIPLNRGRRGRCC